MIYVKNQESCLLQEEITLGYYPLQGGQLRQCPGRHQLENTSFSMIHTAEQEHKDTFDFYLPIGDA